MKKALLVIVAILAVTFLLGNAQLIIEFGNTVLTGHYVPLMVSIVFMIARYLVQAESYDTAFHAIGFRTGYWHNVVLIFSLLFINTFCLFSGATGVAFIIDDARRKGADIGTATGGAILTQIGYFGALLVISAVGMIVMLISSEMNAVFLIGAILLVGVLLILSSFFFVGFYKPNLLYKVMEFVERPIRRVFSWVKHELSPNWGHNTADSFIDTSHILAKNPLGVFTTIAFASLSAVLNMACLVAIGFAFGFTQVVPLVATFAVAAISIQLSPTPQGIGVTEAAITMVLTAYGCSLTTSAAIALVYRGIMLWIPFCVGAVLLSQSGFFKDKKDPTEEKRRKDVAWVSGTLLGLVGFANLILAFFRPELDAYGVLTQFVDLQAVLYGTTQIAGGIVLLLLAIGLVMRLRVVWSLSIATLMVLGGVELYLGVWLVSFSMIALSLWLFAQRRTFDKPLPLPESWREKLFPKKGLSIDLDLLPHMIGSKPQESDHRSPLPDDFIEEISSDTMDALLEPSSQSSPEVESDPPACALKDEDSKN